MQIVHNDGTGECILATDVSLAASVFAQARGLMFRRPLSDDEGLAMPFDDVHRRSLHSAFVFFPFDVVWVAQGTVSATATFRPFRSLSWAPADLIVELPSGAADGVTAGHTLALRDGPEG